MHIIEWTFSITLSTFLLVKVLLVNHLHSSMNHCLLIFVSSTISGQEEILAERF
jgi:hypothetical protein